MKIDKNKVMDILVYLCLATILIWAYLKEAGYINTPTFVTLIPYASAIFAFGMFYQRFINLEKTVREHTEELKRINKEIGRLDTKIQVMDKDIGYLRSDVEFIRQSISGTFHQL